MTLKRLYELHDMEGAFSIGFIFDEELAKQSASNRVSMGWSITCRRPRS